MKRGNTALKRAVSVTSVAAMAIAGAVLAAPSASALTPGDLAVGTLQVRTQPIADVSLINDATSGNDAAGSLVTTVAEATGNVAGTYAAGNTGLVNNLSVGTSQAASNLQVFIPSPKGPATSVGAFNVGNTFNVTLPANSGLTFAAAPSASITKNLVTSASLTTNAGYSNTAKVLGLTQATEGVAPTYSNAVYAGTALASYTGGVSAKVTDANTVTVTFNGTDPNKILPTKDGSAAGYLVTLSGIKIAVSNSKDTAPGAVDLTVTGGASGADTSTVGYVSPWELRTAADAGYPANAKSPVDLPAVTVVESSNNAFTGQQFGFAITGTAAKNTTLGSSLAANSKATPSSKLTLVGAAQGAAAPETSLADIAQIDSANNDLRESFTATGLQVSNLAAGAKATVTLTTPTLGTAAASLFGEAAAQADTGVSIEIGSTSSVPRLAGSSRYATAQDIAEKLVKEGEGTNVILANGTTVKNGADALSANFLAGAEGDAPILLTDSSDTLPSATVDALNYLFKDSAGTSSTVNLFILGKTDSVSAKAAATAEQTIKDAVNAAVSKVNVVRVEGDNRYETSAAAATQASKDDSNAIQSYDLGEGSLKTAFVASGLVNADALAAGGFSAGAGLPVLLVDGDTVNDKVSAAITALGIQQVIVLGGTDRVSDKAVDSLKSDDGIKNVVRIAGSGANGRYNTAALLNTFAFGTNADQLNIGWASNNTAVYLANAMSGSASGFADALTVGPLAGSTTSVVLTTPKDTLPDLTKSFLTTNSSHLGSVTALGQSDRIADSVITAAQAAIQ